MHQTWGRATPARSRPAAPPPSLESPPAEMMEFRARRRPGSPHYTIYLGFGQDLSAGRPKEKSLVLVKVRLGVPGGKATHSPRLSRPVCPDDTLPTAGAVAVPGAPGVRAARRGVLPGQQQPWPLPVQLQQPLRGPGALPHGGAAACLRAGPSPSQEKGLKSQCWCPAQGWARAQKGQQTSGSPQHLQAQDARRPPCPCPPSSVFTMKKQATRFRANKLYSKNRKRPGDRRYLPLQVLGRGPHERSTLCCVQPPPRWLPDPRTPRPAGGRQQTRASLTERNRRLAMAFPCYSKK